MLHSICGLDARYTTQYTIDDISLKGVYVVRCSGRWLGNAESLADARMAALLHYSLVGNAAVH